MERTQRFVIFGVGALIGLVIVNHIMGGRAKSKAARDHIADTRDIPGMLLDYAQKGEPVYDDKGVLESATGPGAEGFARTRRVLTGGRVRFDDAGNRLPDEYLLITEYYAEAGEPTPRSRVARFDFAYADRIRVEVADGHDRVAVSAALKPLGARVFSDAGSRTGLTARFAKPKLATVDDAIAAVKKIPGVVSASPVKLEWRSQLLPQN